MAKYLVWASVDAGYGQREQCQSYIELDDTLTEEEVRVICETELWEILTNDLNVETMYHKVD